MNCFEPCPMIKDVAHPRLEKPRRFRKKRNQKNGDQTGRNTAGYEDGLPAKAWDQPGCDETTCRGADGKADEHDGDRCSSKPLGHEFRCQRDCIRHGTSQAETRKQPIEEQPLKRAGRGCEQGEHPEQQRAPDQNRLSPNSIGQRTEDQRTDHDAH